MGVLSVILGVLLIIGGFSCMFTPLATFLSTGYFLGIMMLVYGVGGIIRAVSHKADALEWILNILAVIVGLIALFRPGSTLIFDSMILVIIACWFVVQGVIQIVLSLKAKGVFKGWYWGLIAGILIGLYFVESGISLIALGATIGSEE